MERTIEDISRAAREAGRILGTLSGQVRASAISRMAEALSENEPQIKAANERDIVEAERDGLEGPMLERLRLTDKTLKYMYTRLREVAALEDPLGIVTRGHTRPSGLYVKRVSVPLGVIAIIYESRPNVTTDAAGVSVKSGNAVILRGGKEALHTNLALAAVMRQAGTSAGLPENAIQIIPTTDREAVGELLRQTKFIDVVIPRGGKSLIERVSNESKIPVIKHFEGICHQYIAADADISQAVAIVVNSKCERVEVCNALETLLVDSAIAAQVLPLLKAEFAKRGVALRGCAECRKIIAVEEASEADWSTEYLAALLSIKVVNGIEEAVSHINRYGSGHTDGIITSSLAQADLFASRVDSASIMINASTRLSGGGDYGLGAVVGISTDKLHARGPVGPEELTTYKWIAQGSGHLR